jgi:hypothetical protein
MDIRHVFAKANAVAGVEFADRFIPGGSHWPADDPIVLARPELFTEDCRYGLMYSGDPPPYMNVPPEEEQLRIDQSSASMTARTRAKSRAMGGPG